MQPMSKGINNCQQLNTNEKSAIKIGFFIDHKAYLTSSKGKNCYPKYKVASNTCPIQRGITRCQTAAENAQKSSADYYSTQEQKASWFETRSQLPTRQTFTYDLTRCLI